MFVSQAGVGIPPVRPGRRGTTPPLGLEAKSLKNGTTHYWISRSRAHTNKNKKTKLSVKSHPKVSTLLELVRIELTFTFRLIKLSSGKYLEK